MTVQTAFAEIVRSSGAMVREPARTVAERLFERISTGFYSYGTRLPAERELASAFGVTRNAVRDALDLLARNRIITRRAGSGSFITYRPEYRPEPPGAPARAVTTTAVPEPDRPVTIEALDVAEATSLVELQVVRGIVEPELVRLAVIHMAPRDIERLRQRLGELEAIETDAEAFSRAEEAFLLQLARGTHNPLLISICEHITRVRRLGSWSAHRQKALSPARIRDVQRRYRSMFDAIERRDIEQAVEYVKLQLVDEQRVLMREG
jgi:DNA-binding FadR family transcriptional regulator